VWPGEFQMDHEPVLIVRGFENLLELGLPEGAGGVWDDEAICRWQSVA